MNLIELFGDWYYQMKVYLESSKFTHIAKIIEIERKTKEVYPYQGSPLFFKAFRDTQYKNVKVIILGQDPYHDPGRFDGLAFSNRDDITTPSPSLRNILREVETDVYNGLNLGRATTYSLQSWADQGVLLINTAHTVVKGTPGSHLAIWKEFTCKVVEAANTKDDIVWLLWGRKAQEYKYLIKNPTHKIIETAHPSPFSAHNGFFGSKCFSKVNNFLNSKIVW